MRILMWFSIGFAASCALGVYILPAGFLGPAAIAFFACCVPVALLSGRWKAGRVILVVLLGLGAGMLRCQHYHTVRIEPARQMDLCVTEAQFTARGHTGETAYGFTVDAETYIGGKSQKVRVYLKYGTELKPGDVFSGTFRFRFAAPKEGEKTSFLQTNGIFLVADQRSELMISGAAQNQWRYFPGRIAQSIKELLRTVFPEDVYPFAKAVLLGDSSDLSYEVDTALKLSGIRHVVAVSGLHVSILYSLVASITGKRRFLTALLGLPLLFLFAAVAGFSPSVTRACVMSGLMMIAQALQKEYDGPTALGFACLVMLLTEPVTVSSVSFQLSAGCVTGILMFHRRVQGWIDRAIRNVSKKEKSRFKSWFSASVAMTISAMSLTTPLSAYYFGTVSIIGIVTNLMTLWVLTAVFIGIIITCVLGLIHLPLAAFLGSILAWPIRYILLVANLLSRTPFSAVYTASGYITVWLVFSYALLFVFFLAKGRRPMLVLSSIALSLCVAIGFSWADPLFRSCTVTVLDVGQGQSIIVQTEGKTFLVDCGGDYGEAAADIAATKLLSMGVGRLDGIFLTHGDDDHTGGLEYLLTRIDADIILLPATESEFFETDVERVLVDRQIQLCFDHTVVHVFPPAFSSVSNENSLCILFDTEKCDILITGDRSERGERRLLSEYEIPQVDLLIAGHHGSKNSTDEAFLRAVQPDTVIISAGKGNIYGHPAPELLERLEVFGCTVFRTDEDGTVVYRR